MNTLIYESNSFLLKKKNNVLYNLLKNIQIDSNIEIIKTKDNNFTIKYNNNLIHSKYNPVREAERYIKTIDYKKKTFFLAIRPGLGYHLNIILNNDSSANILIIENDLSLLKIFLHYFDLNKFPNVYFITNINEFELNNILENKFNILEHSNVTYLVLPNIYSKYTDFINKIQTITQKFVNVKLAQAITLNQFGELFQFNIISNFKYFLKSAGINNLHNKFRKSPILIISAGPSLDRDIEFIKECQNKFIIIAVDTVYKKLINKNIIPDFTVSIDPQNKSFSHFKNQKKYGKLLVVLTSANRVVELWNKDIMFFVSDHPLAYYLNKLTYNYKQIALEGGNAAAAALKLAIFFGSDKIILVGQDLAFSKNKTHCQDTSYETDTISSLSKFNTFETNYFQQNMNYIPIKSINGSTTFTTKQLLGYHAFFEYYINNIISKHITVFNATTEGAYINGAKHLSLKKIISEYQINSNVNKENIFTTEIENKKNINEILGKLEDELCLFKNMLLANKPLLNTIQKLSDFVQQYKGIFDLLNPIVFGKVIIKLHNKNNSEYEKLKIYFDHIIESINYTLDLIKQNL